MKQFITFCILLFSFYNIAFAQIAFQYADDVNHFSLNPGETVKTNINLMSANKDIIQAIIYTVDGTITSNGYFAAKLKEDKQLHLGNWAKLEEDIVDLDYRVSKNIKLTIDIPENAPPGDYSGAIIIEKGVRPTQEDEKTGEEDVSTGLSFTTRLAKPFYVKINGERIPNANIGELTYDKFTGNTYKMFIPLENTGNTAINFHIKPTIKSFYGEQEEIDEIKIQLLPNMQSVIEVPLGELPLFGIYDLSVNVKYSEFDLIKQYETSLGEVSLSAQMIIIPWLHIIIVLILVFGITLFFSLKKRNFKNTVKTSKKYKVKQGDTLTNLAKSSNVDWKIIAKINNLKKPYEIKAGQEILLPRNKK